MFKRNKSISVPPGCENLPIEIDKSICTGEMTVGFREPGSRKLLYAELAKDEKDILEYKKKYGR